MHLIPAGPGLKSLHKAKIEQMPSQGLTMADECLMRGKGWLTRARSLYSACQEKDGQAMNFTRLQVTITDHTGHETAGEIMKVVPTPSFPALLINTVRCGSISCTYLSKLVGHFKTHWRLQIFAQLYSHWYVMKYVTTSYLMVGVGRCQGKSQFGLISGFFLPPQVDWYTMLNVSNVWKVWTRAC